MSALLHPTGITDVWHLIVATYLVWLGVKLLTAKGFNPKYTEIPKTGHYIAPEVAEPVLLWLLDQKKVRKLIQSKLRELTLMAERLISQVDRSRTNRLRKPSSSSSPRYFLLWS